MGIEAIFIVFVEFYTTVCTLIIFMSPEPDPYKTLYLGPEMLGSQTVL